MSAEGNDEYLKKFSMTSAQKSQMRAAIMTLIDRQLDAMESTYLDMFKSLPREVAEKMSPEEASRYVDMVIKEAAGSITRGAEAIHNEAEKITNDEEKMASIRKEFLDSLNFKEAE